jgi:hypothetical protein
MNILVVEGIAEYLKEYDTSIPCPTYEPLRETWLSSLEGALESEIPWDEFEVPTQMISSHIDFISDIFTMFLALAKSRAWSTLNLDDRLEHVKRVISYPQITQRTTDWYLQSKGVLTASEFASILGTDRARCTLALQKVAPIPETPSTNRLACSTPEMGPFDWGIRFEPVVKQILEMMWGCKILEIGRLVHKTDTRLAASPDGLIESAQDPNRVGRLLEIKCPVKREINGKIPFEYWCQMQIQMEVADIDECDYIEVKIASAYKDSQYVEPSDETVKYKGNVWLFQANETCEMKYAYTEEERKKMVELEWNCIETIPWHMNSHFTTTVQRDRAWFESTLEKRNEFWKAVDSARQGLLVLAPSSAKARTPTVTVCKIMDD